MSFQKTDSRGRQTTAEHIEFYMHTEISLRNPIDYVDALLFRQSSR